MSPTRPDRPSDAAPARPTTRASVLWNLGGQGSVQAVRLASTLVLATLLSPGDFGLMAMALVVTGFVELFVDLGTGQAVIQRRLLGDTLCSSVFWANLALGAIAALAVAGGAGAIAAGFDEPALQPIAVAIAPSFVVASLGVVPCALLQREMRFDHIARARLAAALASAFASIGVAAAVAGPWALLVGHYASALCSTAGLCRAARWRPRALLVWSDLHSVAGFSLNLLATNVTNFAFAQIDSIVVGRWFGRDALGCYSLAKRIVLQPVMAAGSAVSSVLFSRFARLADEPRKIAERYVDASAALAALLVPAACGMALLADPFVQGFAGPRWALVAPLVGLLAPAAIAATVLLPTGALYRAVGRTDLLLRIGLMRGGMLAAGVAGGAWLAGVGGAALGMSLGMLAAFGPGFMVPLRLIGLPCATVLRSLAPVVVALVAMCAATLAVREAAPACGWTAAATALGASACGALAYTGALLAQRPRFLGPLLGRAREATA